MNSSSRDLSQTASSALEIERLRLARVLVEEAIRRGREHRNPVNQAGRALRGFWRSVASGGWE